VFEQAYGHVPWAEIPVQLEEIRQIEVIKGPNSLYGFNAVSGVINIITYDPMIDAVNAATLGGGTQSYLDSSAVVPASSAIPLGSTIRGRHAGEGLAPGQLDAAEAASRQPPQTATFNIEAKARPTPRSRPSSKRTRPTAVTPRRPLPAPSTPCPGGQIHSGWVGALILRWGC
jgi:outer membrane receptor for ferrienterochelin and colicins